MANLPGFSANFGLTELRKVEGLLQPPLAVTGRRPRTYSRCLRTCMRRGGSLGARSAACGLRAGKR